MSKLKTIGLSLLALLVLGAFVASAASAEEGFLPLKNKKATVVGGVATLSAGGAAITCQKLDLSLSPITFENDKHAKGTLHFLECILEPFGVEIHSLGDSAGEILVTGALFLVCLNPTATRTFGVAVEVANLHLEAPAIGVLIEVNGRVIGTVLTAGPAKNYEVEFAASEGVQEVKACKEGKATKEHTLTSETNHSGKPEAATEKAKATLEFEEEQELMDS